MTTITFLLAVIVGLLFIVIEGSTPPPPPREPDITDGMSRRELEEYMEWKNGRDIH